jgi:rfaE bifunctional protein nucleotidyltransferase chain/domain
MNLRDASTKLIDRNDLAVLVKKVQASGQTVVFTNGCFDLLHPGHIHLLQASKAFGDLLIVAINTDDSIRGLKGAGRPIYSEQERAYILSALACVDYVVLFHEPTPIPLLERLKPEILVKGAHYSHQEVVGWNVVEAYGGRIERAPIMEGLSTTGAIERIRGIDDSLLKGQTPC